MNDVPLKIYTDGGCSGNPGPGGWAYVIIRQISQDSEIIEKKHGAEKNTTNNKMELTAVIEALRALKTIEGFPLKAVVYTDSQYVQKGITEWIHNWKRNSWRTADKKPVKNQELWTQLDSLAAEFEISWEWVKGHAGNEFNEMCDSMTQTAIKSIS
ncbi:MAG: ribonuclease HI [Treponema sp.]|jgi:ribonuclease HI|nr:ribonuclease HI [Treponema sp.]